MSSIIITVSSPDQDHRCETEEEDPGIKTTQAANYPNASKLHVSTLQEISRTNSKNLSFRTVTIDSINPSAAGKEKKPFKKSEESKKINDLNDSCRCIIL